MSADAKTLLYWISNAQANVADNDAEAEYCFKCARTWANYIFNKEAA